MLFLKNILVQKDKPWRVKIGDFGLSKRAEEARLATTKPRHTEGYTPPEFHGHINPLPDDHQNACARDLWALGVITYQILTRQIVFPDDKTVLGQYTRGEVALPIEPLQRAEVSGLGVEFIQRLLHPDPRRRLTAKQASEHPWIAFIEERSNRRDSVTSIEYVHPSHNTFLTSAVFLTLRTQPKRTSQQLTKFLPLQVHFLRLSPLTSPPALISAHSPKVRLDTMALLCLPFKLCSSMEQHRNGIPHPTCMALMQDQADTTIECQSLLEIPRMRTSHHQTFRLPMLDNLHHYLLANRQTSNPVAFKTFEIRYIIHQAMPVYIHTSTPSSKEVHQARRYASLYHNRSRFKVYSLLNPIHHYSL